MRIEPIYLVAPAKQKPPALSRRAFLLAGGAFALGLGSGGACGYALGARKAAEPAANEPDATAQLPPPSGDAELDELRRLAVVAPIEELVAQRDAFTDLLVKQHHDDDVLWKGLDRLVEQVLADPAFPQRRIFAAWLRQIIENGGQHATDARRDSWRALRDLR